MPLDPEWLMRYPIPEVRHRLDRRSTALYALSIGLGIDPLNRHSLNFVDFDRPRFQALPLMAVVAAYPGFWLGKTDTGVDATRLVLGEQRVEWHRPLPTEGEVIGRTKVTGIVDKGPGKGALLYSDKELIDPARDELIAVTSSTTFLRGDGGCGTVIGPVPTSHTVPEREPDRSVDLATRPEQALYYRLNGDDNPLHADPDFALKGGFRQPILHGLCTLGVAFHALLSELASFQPERIRLLSVRFSAPVFPGETIRTEMWSDGSFRARVVERDVVVLSNGHVGLAG